MAKKKSFRLPRLRKSKKKKAIEKVIVERVSNAKPIGQVLRERREKTKQKIKLNLQRRKK